jgi:hypothetical protein
MVLLDSILHVCFSGMMERNVFFVFVYLLTPTDSKSMIPEIISIKIHPSIYLFGA